MSVPEVPVCLLMTYDRPSIHPAPHETASMGTPTCAEATVRRQEERCTFVTILQELPGRDTSIVLVRTRVYS